MAAKTIALDADTYEMLRRHKRPGETFSDVVRRELRPPAKISDLAGELSGLSPGVWKEVDRVRRASRQRDRGRGRRMGAEGGRS
jgi:predicted CopG family antitoxin